MEIPIIVAIVGAISAVVAAIVSAMAQRNVRQLQERFEKHRQVTTFLSDQLSKLYLPVSMHLRATRALSNTHYEADDATKKEIEHALREHNKVIVERLLTCSMYLDPGAAEDVTVALLEHLLQWESVYKLKYDYGRYTRPVWDGIRHFGYRRFPDEAADYFHKRAIEIREDLHNRLRLGI
jgi:hypothetical protein